MSVADLMTDRVPVEANVEFDIEDFERPGTHGMDEDFTVAVNAPVQWEFLGNVVSDFHATVLEEIIGQTERIITRVRDQKSPAPWIRVVAVEPDTIYAPYADAVSQVTLLGNDAGESEFPLTKALYDHFQSVGEMWPVRLDTLESYEEFRSAPEMADEAMAGMLGHLGDMSRLARTQEEIPLSLPFDKDTYRCWREGEMVCCSIAVPGPDGEMRICTSWTPAEKHVNEVVGHAHAIGVKDVTTMLGVLPTVACMMGGSELAPRLAAAAPALLARPEVQDGGIFVGAMVANHPSLAALMALWQEARGGNVQAAEEWKKFEALAHLSDELDATLKEAKKRVKQGLKAQAG